jgi:hypothetical protein
LAKKHHTSERKFHQGISRPLLQVQASHAANTSRPSQG